MVGMWFGVRLGVGRGHTTLGRHGHLKEFGFGSPPGLIFWECCGHIRHACVFDVKHTGRQEAWEVLALLFLGPF